MGEKKKGELLFIERGDLLSDLGGRVGRKSLHARLVRNLEGKSERKSSKNKTHNLHSESKEKNLCAVEKKKKKKKKKVEEKYIFTSPLKYMQQSFPFLSIAD